LAGLSTPIILTSINFIVILEDYVSRCGVLNPPDIIKAVFFDLDGILVDTIGDIAFAMNRVLKEFGFAEHPAEAYKDFVGYGLRITARNALPEQARDEETILRAGELLVSYYAEHPVDKTRPYEGVTEMLGMLHDAGIPTVVLTNKAQVLADMVVSKLLPGFEFAAVRGADSDFPLKPDPASALALAEDTGVSPGDVLFVGDSEVDVITARAAGMFPAGVAWGFRKPEVLSEAGAEVIFEKPVDIVEFVQHNVCKGDI